MKTQRGFALMEAMIATGIAAFCAGALVLLISGMTKFGAHANGPHRTAALAFARQTLRTAQDAWKYGSPGDGPDGTADVTVPVAGPDAVATTMPVRLNATLGAIDSSGGTSLSITVFYPPDAGRADPGILTLSARLRALAPVPAAKIEQPGLVAQPNS